MLRASEKHKPRQVDLRRAMSTAYYAMFHQLCQNCADCLIGGKASDRSLTAWAQAYRAVEHRFAKNQCRNTAVLSKFPKSIEDFGNKFQELQVLRHKADYDPLVQFTKTQVLDAILSAEQAIKDFRKTPIKHRRAFAAWTSMKARGD